MKEEANSHTKIGYWNVRCCTEYMQCHKLLLLWPNCCDASKTDRPQLHLQSPSHFASFDFLHLNNVLLSHLYKDFSMRHFCCINLVGEKPVVEIFLQASSSSEISYNLKHHSSEKFFFDFFHVVNLVVVNYFFFYKQFTKNGKGIPRTYIENALQILRYLQLHQDVLKILCISDNTACDIWLLSLCSPCR